MPSKPHVIALDAQGLREGSWPRPNARLQKLADLCQLLGIKFWIVEGARDEVRGSFLRSLREALRGVERAANELRRLGVEVTTTAASEADAMASWDSRSAAAAAEFGAYVSPATNRPTAEFFAMGIERTPPFDEKGAGFRDAVIFASLVDEMKRSGLTEGVLVSKDRDFLNAPTADPAISIRPLAIDGAISLLEEVLQQLQAGVFKEMMEREAAREQEVAKALLDARSVIEKFLESNLAIGAADVDGLEGLLVKPVAFRLAKVSGVTTSPTFAQVQPGIEVDASVTAELDGDFEIQVLDTTPSRLKLGQDALEWSLEKALRLPERRLQTVRFPVSLDFRALRTADGYAEISPSGVRPFPPSMRALWRAILGETK